MGALSTELLERKLLSLDDDEFVDFVATLWRESGWSVEREGNVLDLSRQGASRRLLVLPPRRVAPSLRRAPETSGPIDEVVVPFSIDAASELPRGTPAAADVVDVSGIRERLYYALDDGPRERLLHSQLGIRASAPADHGGTLRPLPPLRASRLRGSVGTSAGVTVLVVGLMLFVLATGIPFGGWSTSGTADATEPSSAGSVVTVSAPVYEATQTCDRGPGEVVELSTAAVRGSSLSRGLVVMGKFLNPTQIRSSPHVVWYDRMQSTSRLPFYDANTVTLGQPSITGDEAVINATATDSGTDYQFQFDLSRTTDDEGEHCWMIDSFGPA